MTEPIPHVTAVPLAVDDHPPLELVVVQPRKAAKTQRARPTVIEVRGLQGQLSISQASSAKQISLLCRQLAAQLQAFSAERDEMCKFMAELMRQQRGQSVEETVRLEALPVIDR